MTDTIQDASTTHQTMLFNVRLDWLVKQQGLLSVDGIPETIEVATPLEFNGTGNMWSPEHLFLASISSCFMTTYLAFAKKFRLSISDFTCSITGEIALVSGKYQFTRIDLYPVAYVAEEALKESAKKALQKTEAYCLISQSIATSLICHPEVRIGERPESDFKNNIRDVYARL